MNDNNNFVSAMSQAGKKKGQGVTVHQDTSQFSIQDELEKERSSRKSNGLQNYNKPSKNTPTKGTAISKQDSANSPSKIEAIEET